MGSKEKPGSFDCYEDALPNEPLFTLLARDRHAPDAVEKWADSRELEILRGYGGNKNKLAEELRQLAEARRCAEEMRAWRTSNMGAWKPGIVASSLMLLTNATTFQAEEELYASIHPDFPAMLIQEEWYDEEERVLCLESKETLLSFRGVA